MAIRNVRINEDPVLRKVSKHVDNFNERLGILASDMTETMYKEDGVGLAAPQVGILKRMMIVDIYDDNGVKVYVNPKIIYEDGEQFEIEGCLSVPNVSGYVKRPAIVKVKAYDLKGKPFEVIGEGLLARALCHEIDHLNGILFIDKMEIKEDEK